MELYCIYALVATDAEDVFRYVGKTKIGCIDRRVRQHITSVNRRHTPKNSWVKAVIARGQTIKAVIIEVCDSDVWEEREKHWIAHYRLIAPLTNVSEGGDTGPNMTGYRHSDETKALIAKAGTGRKKSQEAIEKFKASRKGWRPTPEQVEKSRTGLRALVASGSTWWKKATDAAVKANTGRKYSHEHCVAISLSQLGRKQPTPCLLASRKPVVCVETGTWFCSAKEASTRCGTGRTHITNAIKSGGKSLGYHWAFGERKTLG